MDDGFIRDAIPFVAWFRDRNGSEVRNDFTEPNTANRHGDSDLFSRLSFESIRGRFLELGYEVSHIVRGECSESGSSSCYVFAPGDRIPFATIRPAVFAA